MEAERRIMLVAQKAAAKDEPSVTDMFEVGCVSTILQMLKLPDGTVKVLVEGQQRARVSRITEGAQHFVATVVPVEAGDIDGKSAAPSSGEHMLTDDPFTGRAWARIARGTRVDAEAAVGAAMRAFRDGPWPAMTASERGRLLWRLADAVTANAERLAEVERRDNGKLAAEVVTQVRYMGDYFRYYAGLADKEAGRLVAPLQIATAVDFAYYLVHPKAKGRLPQVKAFVSWIEAEALAHEEALRAIDYGAGI